MPRLIHVTTVPHTLHFLIGQVGFMQRAGLDVETCSTRDSKLDYFLQHESVRHHAITMQRALSPFRDAVATWKLYRLFRRRRPDVVHAHTPKAGLLGMLAAALAGVPVRFYHIHGLRFATLTGWKRRLITACEKWTCRLATQVLCVSRSAQEVAVAEGVVRADRIKVLHHGSINGMDATVRFNRDQLDRDARDRTRQRLHIPKDAVVIGFVGRLVRDKGIAELTSAWQSVRRQCPEARLLLIGDYESQDPVPAAVRRGLHEDPRIHRVSYDPETPPLFAAMDILCLPTYREGLPYVLLEASAMQLPIVATQVTGCVDAVQDGVTGTLVPPRDAPSLATALLRYAQDAALRQRHGAAGRHFVRRDFQPSAVWAALLTEYATHLHSARRALPVPAAETNSRAA